MPPTPVKNLVAFEYLYRDASNYKAFGQLLLTGQCSPSTTIAIVNACESGEFFVAEQVGVPTLYEALYQLSGGLTEDDHVFHEFLCIRPATSGDMDLIVTGDLKTLITKFQNASDNWNPSLSRHWGMTV